MPLFYVTLLHPHEMDVDRDSTQRDSSIETKSGRIASPRSSLFESLLS